MPDSGHLRHSEESPGVGHALELMSSQISELDPRSQDEILDGPRDQNRARFGLRHDPVGEMHGQPPDLITGQLHLSGMEPGSNLDAELIQFIGDPRRADDCSGRAVEHRKKAIAGVVHLASSVLAQVLPDQIVVGLTQGDPGGVTDPSGGLRGADYVGEQDRAQHTIHRRYRGSSCQELLDLIQDCVGVTCLKRVGVGAW